jgi:hypothetical protein
LSAPVAAAISRTAAGGDDREALEAVSAPAEPVLAETVCGVIAVLPLFSSISIVTRIVSPQARIA